MGDELIQALSAAAKTGDQAAEQQLKNWQAQNYAEFAVALATVIGTEHCEEQARTMAGVYLKNMLYAKSTEYLLQNHERWKALDSTQRNRIKQALLQSLLSTAPSAAHSAAMAASEIAAVELPYNEWNEFVPALMERVTSNEVPDVVKLHSLECLGFAAERIAELEEMLDQPELSSATVDKMLTTIVNGVGANRSDTMRVIAIRALYNSLVFVRKNMEVKGERDFIMQAVCEATRSQDSRVRELAFQCMDQIAQYYYDKLQDYMTTIFQLTTEAIKTDTVDTVKSAAIEFWSSVASQEQVLLDEEKEYLEMGRPLERAPCPKYMQSAMENLVPLLLDTLSQQDDDVEEDSWSLQSTGACCLEATSATVEELIIPLVMPFIELNIKNANWRLRDAAIVAFASILDGPSTSSIGKYVVQAIPVVLEAFGDQNVVVRDDATHCIANICRLHIMAVPHEMLLQIIQGLIAKLGESPRVAGHACTAIFNIAQALKTPDMPESNILSAPMMALLQALMQTSDRGDAVEANLRVSAMSAAAELVTSAAHDVLPIFREFLPVVLHRVETTMKAQVVTNDDNEIKEQMLGLLYALMSTLLQKLEKNDVLPHAPRIMDFLLHRLSHAKPTSSAEEALVAVGALAGAIEEGFEPFVPKIMPIIMAYLQMVQIPSLCIVTVGVVVDICPAIGSHLQPYCDELMTVLSNVLRDSTANREIKPTVISCFGDIAMAINAAFEPYLQMTCLLLMQAAQTTAPAEDEDLVAFINSLRVAIIEAYSGIIMGLADGGKLQVFVVHVPPVFQLLQFLAAPQSNRDDDVLSKIVALIGDIAMQMGSVPQVKDALRQPFIMQLVQEGGQLQDPSAQEVARWTQEMVQQALSS